MANYKRIPHWLPDYCSFALLRLAHNMFPTDSKFTNGPTLCHLCRQDGSSDSTKHIFHDCAITSKVLQKMNSLLKWARSDVGKVGWLCADKTLDSISIAIVCILINSVWVARCYAARGCTNDPVTWIVTDCLNRAHKIHDRIFVSNFPDNEVPNHLKVAYKRASKRKYGYDADPPPLQTTINNHLARLPPDTLAIFTDGSAVGNPPDGGEFRGQRLHRCCHQ
jgi:hypothetical protein